MSVPGMSRAAIVVLLFAALAAPAMAQAPSGLPVVRAKPGQYPAKRLPDALRDVGIDQKLNSQIPLDLPFLDEDGRNVKLGDYFGKRPVILSLVYYDCPMLCTMVLNGLVRAMRPLSLVPSRDFEIVTVSFDPKETPPLAESKKRLYTNLYHHDGAQTGWHFLTGNDASIKALADAVGFRYRFDEASGQYAHASGIMVLTPEGKLSRYFYGVEYSGRDLRFGLIDASSGKIGTIADQVLLYCFHYDPATSRYGVAIMNVMRLCGIATVLALGVFIVGSVWKEKGAPRPV